MPGTDTNVTDAMILCESSRGAEIHGTLVRLSRQQVSFEIYSAAEVVQLSEVLSNFRVVVRDQTIYSGRATITSLVNVGPALLCQANLEASWLEMDVLKLAQQPASLEGAFTELVRGWQKVYKIQPEYKVVVADIQSFLFELRHWVEEIELGMSGFAANGGRAEAERQAVDELVKPITPCLNHLFEKFEIAANAIPPEAQAVHGLYAKRHLHPLLMCSPFMHRIYRKPLGYAGDYEMVNMILREPYEGSSLFAKLLNSWFLGQSPAEAHRNRVKYLTQRLTETTALQGAPNRPLRIYNLGCGPAQEIGDFLKRSELSDRTEFTLLDFNDETLAYTRRTLEAARRRYNRATRLQLVKKSVGQVLKAGMRQGTGEFDIVYCAGLFDYLTDRVCRQVMNIFYEMLAPGGLLIATNVDAYNPIRNIMGYIFEWRLIERNAQQMLGVSPGEAPPDNCKVTADVTGCNIFLEVRKPAA